LKKNEQNNTRQSLKDAIKRKEKPETSDLAKAVSI
jgi:hypothetical protein